MDGLQLGILFNQGASLLRHGSRVFVQDTIYDKFIEAVGNFNAVKVGLSWERIPRWALRSTKNSLKKILSYVEIGKNEGASVACGGFRITDGELAKGAFMRPTLHRRCHQQDAGRTGGDLRAGRRRHQIP